MKISELHHRIGLTSYGETLKASGGSILAPMVPREWIAAAIVKRKAVDALEAGGERQVDMITFATRATRYVSTDQLVIFGERVMRIVEIRQDHKRVEIDAVDTGETMTTINTVA